MPDSLLKREVKTVPAMLDLLREAGTDQVSAWSKSGKLGMKRYVAGHQWGNAVWVKLDYSVAWWSVSVRSVIASLFVL